MDCQIKERDYQRKKVYTWEDRHIRRLQGAATLEDAEKLVKKVWRYERRKYNVRHDSPVIARSRSEQYVYFNPDKHALELNDWSCCPEIVLHELAHALNPGFSFHGSHFLSTYIALLSKYAGYAKRELIDSAEASGLLINMNRLKAIA